MTSPLEKACEFLARRAFPSYNKDTCGHCAQAVRMAVDFGFDGKHVEKVEDAKDYAPSYLKLGFKSSFQYPAQPKEEYHPKLGDICILQATPKHIHGHICMYNGRIWISDFVQRDMYGGPMRDEDPKFDIYRYA